MKCPRCSSGLTMGERKGIEIDDCASCRGIWLDGGELEKIIARSGTFQDRSNDRSLGEIWQEGWREVVVDLLD